MIPLEEARALVLSGCRVTAPATLPLREALGCVTAEPVVSAEAVPPFDNSAMDGYAVRADDTDPAPSRLRIVDELRAGQAPSVALGPGEAIRIMTGAPMPPGADAVVMVEDTATEGNVAVISSVARQGQHLRRAGSDVMVGDVVFPAGLALSPAHLGVLASIGRGAVTVFPRLRVGILSSGDELVEDGSRLAPGQVREANKELLIGLVEEANAVPIDLGLVRDEEAAIEAAFADAEQRCDALITSGGVSMGDYDLIKAMLDKLGRMQWMQIAIQPAKPFAFGLLGAGEGAMPVFGLPGNPVSSMVSFELLARPALRKMMGHPRPERPSVLAVADDGLARRAGDGKVHWQRVHATFGADGRLHVTTTGAQGSHQLANSASANALAALPDGPGVPAGGEVAVTVIGPVAS